MSAPSKTSPKQGRAHAKLTEIFGADLRSLATLRIVLGVLVLVDLAIRSADLVAHYTDAGVMPRVALEPPDPLLFPQALPMISPWAFSLNTFSGGLLLQALMFVVGAVAAVALLAGYRTRVASVVVWVALLSIQQRNPLILTSGDILLRMLLFWAMFLPLGAIWSVDRLRGAVVGRLSMRYFSLATVALFLQIALIYWFTALLKTGPEWRTDFSALYYALSLDQVTRPFGQFLLDFPTLLTVMTAATILLEIVGPFLLFSPFFTGPVRTAGILAFMGLHFGIFLTMDIGLFPFISAFCMVCFLPSWFWNEVVPKLRAALPGWPRAAARRLRAYLLERPRARRTGAGMDPTTLKASFASDLLAVSFLVIVLFWNLTSVVPVVMPAGTAPLSLFLGLDQRWNMFAPRPTVDDGWHVVPGTLQNGERVDLMPILRGELDPPKEVSWEKPPVVAYETNVRWNKYLEFMGLVEHADQRPYFSSYLCRAWNERHTGGERLEGLRIIYMRESTLPDYKTSDIEKVRLWDHRCAS